jgi:hypothetical protein
MVIATGLAVGVSLGEVLPAGATVQVNPPQASCYAFYYYDNLSSLYENSVCGSATSTAGYGNTYAGVNDTGQTAFTRGKSDAVFFAAGHSIDFCTGSNCSGVAFNFEAPNGGTIDALVGDSSYTAELSGPFLSDICDDANNCHMQSSTAGKSYSWGTAAELDEINLVVLEGCVTANNSQGTSMGLAAYDAGAGTTIGFTQNISFALNTSNVDAYGYAWGHRFWNDLQGQSTYYTSMIDAANYENSQSGGWYGYNSYYMYTSPGAPNSLYPAEYWYLVGCYACL